MTGPSLCPYCGGPQEPGQEYCLECGSRLPRSGALVRALAGAWQRLLPWYPGDWIWPSLATLVIAGILLPGQPAQALFIIAAATLLLLFVGIHNAWDNVTFIAIDLSQRENKPQEK